MKSILMTVATLFAVASGARADSVVSAHGPRCRLNPQGTPSVLVRYPVPHGTIPPGEGQHDNKHTEYKVVTALASTGQTLGEHGPAVLAIGDFDGNDICDLLWDDGGTETQPATRLAVTYGFTQAYEQDFVAQGTPKPASPWNIVGAFDFTGDGVSEVLWWHARNGDFVLWRRHEEQTPPWVASPVSLSIDHPRTWYPLVIARLSADGPPGLVMGDANGTGHAYFEASGMLELVPAGPLLGLPSPGWRAVAVGDFNADTNEDLLLQHMLTRRLKVCFMAGLAASECTDLVPNTFELGPPHGPSHIGGPR